jgi:short subunit dehydrogenase
VSRNGWTAADVPDQSGRVAVVTGASAGLGLATTTMLAARAATVVMACRDVPKGERVAERIRAANEHADVRVVRLDLASLASVREATAELEGAAAGTIALAAHPGNVRTGLWRTSSRLERLVIGARLGKLTSWLAQDVQAGALPTLRAALDPSARGGDYFGPAGRFEYTGRPIRVEPSPAAREEGARRQLWDASEALTGVTYRLGAAAA